MEHAGIEVLRGCTMGHTGDACLPQRPISSPFREDCVDGRVMDGWVATGLCRYGQALPLPPRREAPHDEVKDAIRAQCALETSLGHREVREDTSLERWGGELDRHRRRCRLWGCYPPEARASHKACGREREHQSASEMTRGADVCTTLATRDNCQKNERNGNVYQRNHAYQSSPGLCRL